jgi:hypothetical protein
MPPSAAPLFSGVQFPNIALCNEQFYQNKADIGAFDCVMAIPAGRPSVAWLTTRGGRQACVMAKIGRKRIIQSSDQEVIYTPFPPFLDGTMFVGTFFFTNRTRRFAIEDLGRSPSTQGHLVGSYLDTLNTIQTLLTAMTDYRTSHPSSITFGIPAIAESMDSLEKLINAQHISICQLKYRHFDRDRAHKIAVCRYTLQTHTAHQMIWSVSAELEDDIYTIRDGGDRVIGTALIPTYTSSVAMNRLFRRVRENTCLDHIEDSEDEDDFESDRIDQFVNLDKNIHMVCELHPRFKKWMPLYPTPPL